MKLNNKIYDERKTPQKKVKNVSKKPASQVSKARVKRKADDIREEQVYRPVPKKKKLTRKEKKRLERSREREEIIRETNLRKRKKHKKNYVLYYILLAFFILLTAVILSFTVFFKISTITIEGTEIDGNTIIEQSGIQIGENLLRVNAKNIKEKILAKNIDIDKVTVKRTLPDKVTLQVEMAEPEYNIYQKNTYYLISKNNRVIKTDNKETKDVITVYGCDVEELELGSYIKYEDNNKLSTLKLITDAINNEGLTSITKIDLTDMIAVKLYYKNQYLVNLGEPTKLDYKISKVKQLIETKLSNDENGVLDVSIDGKTFYRVVENIDDPDAVKKDELTSSAVTSESESNASSDTESTANSKEETSSSSKTEEKTENE